MRAVKVGFLLVLLFSFADQFLHLDDLSASIKLYQEGEWGAPTGWIMGRTIGVSMFCSFIIGLVCSIRNFIVGHSRQARKIRIQQELQILSAKRQEETIAFAKSMLTGIEDNQLGPDAIELLAEILSRPGRQISRYEVVETLRCLLRNPDYLRPNFDSLESEWVYEKQTAEIVRGGRPA